MLADADDLQELVAVWEKNPILSNNTVNFSNKSLGDTQLVQSDRRTNNG